MTKRYAKSSDPLGTEEFLQTLRSHGIDFVSGVPCSLFTDLPPAVELQLWCKHVPATHEGEAVAIASGAWLAGRKPVVYMQNSGLGNVVNPVTSLCEPFGVPLLMLVSWRGQPGYKDEPQHYRMGQITPDLLSLLGVEHADFPDSKHQLSQAIGDLLNRSHSTGMPSALIVPKGAIGGDIRTAFAHQSPRAVAGQMQAWSDGGGEGISRFEALGVVREALPQDCGIVATTGKTGRELFTMGDTERQFYSVGAMGLASAVGLGVAMNTAKKICVIDGDGAALMKLGNMATIGAVSPSNLYHIVLDNECHDSTGGQPTVSPSTDFARVALACGYLHAIRCASLDGLNRAIKYATETRGPTLIHAKIKPGSQPNLLRPDISPDKVAQRFKAFLSE